MLKVGGKNARGFDPMAAEYRAGKRETAEALAAAAAAIARGDR